ncbi:MAG: hypothetical protein JW828_00395 [Sedimentisphaerales bacterium]|nr:hypothetical protein [Sedimentisphaerales bacterium]
MNNDKENRKELLRQFFNPDDADRIEADLEWGDRAMGQWPLAQPDPTVVAGIKKKIHTRLQRRRKSKFWILIGSISSVAAALVLASVILVGRVEPPAGEIHQTAPIISPQIWQIDSAGEMQLAELADELDEIMDTMLDIRLDEYGGMQDNSVEEYHGKIETAVVTSDFWKG